MKYNSQVGFIGKVTYLWPPSIGVLACFRLLSAALLLKLVDFGCCLPALLGIEALEALLSVLAAPLTIVVAMSERSCPAVRPTDRDRAAVRLSVAELHKSPN